MKHLEVNGARIAYTEAGTTGTPICFVHGGFCAADDWRFQINDLASDHRVFALDLRGHGDSRVDDPRTCTVETFADDVLTVARSLDLGPATFVGHSLGCRILLEAGRNHPAEIERLVLLDGSRQGSRTATPDTQLLLVALQARGVEAVLRDLFADMFVADSDPAVRDQILARLGTIDERVATAVVPSTVLWDARELETALDRIDVPVLALQSTFTAPGEPRRSLTGTDDPTPWLEVLSKHLTQLRVEIVPRVGHFCMLDAPNAVNAAIRAFVD